MGVNGMRKYNAEFRESIQAQMFPLGEVPLKELSKKTGVPYATLLDWRNSLRAKESCGVGDNDVSKDWSSEDKFNIVLQTAVMSEEERNGFCRGHGIFPEQIEIWRDACMSANAEQSAWARHLRSELRAEKDKTLMLERDLRRKEKALAETAALLVLRKKADAIWGDKEEE
jgi:transposase-like protein